MKYRATFYITVLLLPWLWQGCSRPYSKEKIYTEKNDRLPLHQKVELLLGKSIHSNDDVLLTAISLLYSRNKNWVEAKESIQKAIKINPVNASYHLYLAQYNAKLAQNNEAYNEAKSAYELGAYDTNLEAFLARMAVATADTLRGQPFVEKYYQNNRNSTEAQLLMTQWMALNKHYNAAIKLAAHVLQADSLNTQAMQLKFKAWVKLDSVKLAVTQGEQLVALNWQNPWGYFTLGQLYEQQGNLPKAASYFAKAYNLAPSAETLSLVVDSYNALDMYDSVLYYSSYQVAGQSAQKYNIQLSRARAFDKRYNYDSAFIVYGRLLKIDSTDSVVTAEQAFVQRKIAYLQRKKREQKQLADSLANLMPSLNF